MKCHDCSKELTEGAEYMPYKVDDQEFYKCKDCHQKDPVLRNYQKTEVYSRIVGYIRPTKQWNKGKREEWKDRVTFKVENFKDCHTC